MKINPKYKNAHQNQKAIKMLPELVTFLGKISKEDNASLIDSDKCKSADKISR